MFISTKQRIAIEIGFYLGIFCILFIGDLSEIEDKLLTVFIDFNILYLHALINRIFIFPRFFKTKRYFLYVVFTVASLLAFSAVYYKFTLNAYLKDIDLGEVTFSYINSFSSVVMSLLVMMSIEFIFMVLKTQYDKKQYEVNLKQLEINSLQKQINPHFIYNALNNAYGLALNKPDLAPDYILKLSLLIRYQTESISLPEVTLQDEINFINYYIDVEKQRLGDRITITFNNTINSKLADKIRIAPLLFLSYLENAFKYGTASIKNSTIDIAIQILDKQLSFMCSNQILPSAHKLQGMGLGNKIAAERIRHLYADAIVNIAESDMAYIVNVQIPITI
jgi:two-component system, LytTR family, sensor kinase